MFGRATKFDEKYPAQPILRRKGSVALDNALSTLIFCLWQQDFPILPLVSLTIRLAIFPWQAAPSFLLFSVR